LKRYRGTGAYLQAHRLQEGAPIALMMPNIRSTRYAVGTARRLHRGECQSV
jgi:hypothetical protein